MNPWTMTVGRNHITLMLICIPLMMGLLTACSGSKEPPPEKVATDGFSFFELGAHSLYSDWVRNHLENQLGSASIARRNQIDLEINYPGFLQDHFPELHSLNTALNYPPRERTEHDTIKLMYRHTRNRQAPFRYVELLFREETRKPLYFRIDLIADSQEIIDELIEKYGPAQEIKWEEGKARALHWQRGKEVMIASITPNRFGEPSYRIMIYFVESLEQLMAVEQAEVRRREEEKQKAGKSAF